jgi:NAD(P)-dependent dehydrogenase (short-subunit alcohol dehydrogenase family)
MDLGITGRKALITGSDSGIGLETARLLAEAGVTVGLVDIKLEDAKAAAATIPGALAFGADLTDAQAVQTLKADVEKTLGAPDILVHAAGITGAQGLFHEIDMDGWRKTLETDFFAVVSTVRAFLDGMRASGWGRIVLVASEDAVQPYVDELPYCSAKAAVLNLAKGLSKSYGKEGVMVNTVAPAFIATPMTDAMMEKRAKQRGESFDEAIRSFLKEERPGISLQRRGEVGEVASVIAFLCSERASFVNGANWRVDGGSVQAMGT